MFDRGRVENKVWFFLCENLDDARGVAHITNKRTQALIGEAFSRLHINAVQIIFAEFHQSQMLGL